MNAIKGSIVGISLLFSIGVLLSLLSRPTSARTCEYDVNSDKPNPLGMRAFITLTEEDGDTVAVFEQFPAVLAEKVTIANRRVLIFHEATIEQARQLLLQNSNYYSELVGYEDSEGFAPVNAVLTCHSNAAK